MPYISSSARKDYDDELKHIIERLSKINEDLLGGELNYCFSKLAFGLFEKCPRYVRINTINGAFLGAQQEFSRRKVEPYEDQKIASNGDLF